MALLEPRNAALQVQPQVDGHLLVARPAGVQAAAGVADARDELALDERVHVLVVVAGATKTGSSAPCSRMSLERPARSPRRPPRDSTPARASAVGPRQAPAHVVFEQPAIEAERRAELEQRRVGIAREAAGPEMRHQM